MGLDFLASDLGAELLMWCLVCNSAQCNPVLHAIHTQNRCGKDNPSCRMEHSEDPVKKDVLSEVAAERKRQDRLWGEQNHPDGTSGHNFRKMADLARRSCQKAADGGYVTWLHIAREEFYEVMAETDPEKLRAELVQCAAVFVAWIECIDRRKNG